MKVKDLITYLQELHAPEAQVFTRDRNGAVSSYPIIETFKDTVVIDAYREPRTNYAELPQALPPVEDR